jgi:hypothetical protein
MLITFDIGISVAYVTSAAVRIDCCRPRPVAVQGLCGLDFVSFAAGDSVNSASPGSSSADSPLRQPGYTATA